MAELTNKHITLAVTGGIAAYKACELVRLLTKAGAQVQVVMTPAALEFVGALTFATLSGRAVVSEPFDAAMPHLALTREATDLLLVAPATANCIAKAANGLADDLLSTLILGRSCPLAIAPAMNERMWAAAATQRNIAQLQADGVTILGPGDGDLACGVQGAGRLMEPAQIVAHVRRLLTPPVLAGRRVLITAGPTREPIDPVRALTNLSSGRQGYALAQAAFEAGASVCLVSGPTALPCPCGVTRVDVVTAAQMLGAVRERLDRTDIFIGVAAVADWRAASVSRHKMKKSDGAPQLQFEKNPDILATVANSPNPPYCVGFAAETQDVVAYAGAKRRDKNVALMVANQADEAMGSPDNTVTLITAQQTIALPKCDKLCCARQIIDFIARETAPGVTAA